jgi:hypothetical protein
MDDIMVLKPLPALISACGQVRLCDFGEAGWVSHSRFPNERTSVGDVLLAVRYGKHAGLGLDDLSHCRSRSFRVDPARPRHPDGPVARLGAVGSGVVGQRTSTSRRIDRRCAHCWEAWIDTEVELT